MPWIESHSVLFRHRKVKDLSRTLNIDPVQAIGHLHCLWHTAIEQAEDGDLSSWSAGAIADAAQWKGSEEEFLKAVFSSGFMDKGQLLHDWLDYAGKYLTSKYKTSNPDRLKDIWAKFGKSYGKEVKRNSYSLPEGVPPNLTLPDQTRPNQTNAGASAEKIKEGTPGFADFFASCKRLFGEPKTHLEEAKYQQLIPELQRIGASIDDLELRVAHYRRCRPDWHCSLSAILKNWVDIPQMTAKPKPKPKAVESAGVDWAV